MTMTALTDIGRPSLVGLHPHPLTRVMAWELRRFRASRLFWFQALGFFGFFLLLMWAQGTSIHFSTRNNDGFIAGTSAQGLLLTLPTLLLLLVLLLPFVTAEGVTRDLQRRTHELLLATALPGWAYIWGRYLVCLLMGLALAGLVLCATLLMGWLLHLTIPMYPSPQIAAVFLLWGGLIVPATVLVSSLSFALGTLFPRQSALIKIAILLGWVVGSEILPFTLGSALTSTWYSNWDPTGAITALRLLSQSSMNRHLDAATSAAQFQQLLLALENTMPGIGEWFIPHLLLVGVSLVLVLIAAFAFKRSRRTLS